MFRTTPARLTSDGEPGAHTAFPIVDPVKFKTEQDEVQFIERKIEGMRAVIKDAIRSVKPYKGGNDILWTIHDLDIVDKHRILLAVGFTSPRFRVQNAFDVPAFGLVSYERGRRHRHHHP